MERNLKDYREKELKMYVMGNILIILVGTGMIKDIALLMGEKNLWKAMSELFESSVISTMVYIFSYTLDSILQGKVKDRLIWPLNGIPGKTIFTEIRKNNKDERFTTDIALKAYGDLYKKIDAEHCDEKREKIQNAFWYKLYQKYENQAQIYICQRDFLMFRDMTAMTLWIIIACIIMSKLTEIELPCKLRLYLCIELGVMWVAARVKGKRFAYNVIAKNLAEYEEKEYALKADA